MPLNSYWKDRDRLYLQVVRMLVNDLGRRSSSILDVGSAGGDYLGWWPWVPRRVSLDLRQPYLGPDVESVQQDFFAWDSNERFDIVTCLQVLEHVSDAEAFARKLLRTADCVVVSVPYKWSEGRTKSHIHDPVDDSKMDSWFARLPNFRYVCHEVATDSPRLVAVYEDHPYPWRNLNERRRILKVVAIRETMRTEDCTFREACEIRGVRDNRIHKFLKVHRDLPEIPTSLSGVS